MAKAVSAKIDASPDRIRADYAQIKDRYSSFNRKLRDLIEELCIESKVLSVTGRIKDVESFTTKALRVLEDGSRRYADPIREITDLCGVRIICFTLSQVEAVCEIVNANFDVIEVVDKTAELKAQRKLGYLSYHLIVKLNDKRTCLQEYSPFSSLVSEIQVRTILQHAWAEIEHRVQYKRAEIDNDLFNKFLALSGLIQIADREFEGIVDTSNKLGSDIVDPITAEQDDGRDVAVERLDPASRKLHDIKHMFGVGPRELMQNHEFDKAEAVYSEFIKVQSRQPSHYQGRAAARISMGRLLEANADLHIAQGLSPDNPSVQRAIDKIEEILATNQSRA